MNVERYSMCAFIFVLCIFITGCAGLSSKKWENLTDRKFYLVEFQYIHKGDKNETAFNDIKNFPVKKIMYALARDYNIEIDLSDFNKFVKTGNTSEIKTSGLFRDEKFTWNSSKTDIRNRIVIVYEKDYFDESKMKFSITAYSDKKILKKIDISFSNKDHIFKQFKYYLSLAEESFAEYDKNDFENKNNVPGLILGYYEPVVKAEGNPVEDIKSKLDNHVKSLSQEQKEIFKHEMIDYIYKICK